MMLVLFFGLVTFIAAQHYIRIFNSCVDDACSHRWPSDVHRSLPLHQDLQLLRDDACSHPWPRDVHRSLPLHQDLQFFGE